MTDPRFVDSPPAQQRTANAAQVGTSRELIDTPAVTIDLALIEQNIARLQRYLSQHGLRNRPHIKTHKLPAIARMQVAAGAAGITCQKLGEAEVMAAAGLDDILLTYNVLGEAKLERLVALVRRISLSVTLDHADVASGLSASMRRAGLTLPVLIECDTGGRRCGVQNPAEAVELAQAITRLPGLIFRGLMTYPTVHASGEFMRETIRLLNARGITVNVVSGGGTPGVWKVHEVPGFTEHRAGTYVYNDCNTVAAGAATLEDCAMRIMATVISRPTRDRAILDAGSKTLSSDLGQGVAGHGLIVEYPEAVIATLSEEHGHVDVSLCRRAPKVGDRVSIVPNHACVVSNLHNEVYGVRAGRVEVVWPVEARGAVR